MHGFTVRIKDLIDFNIEINFRLGKTKWKSQKRSFTRGEFTCNDQEQMQGCSPGREKCSHD